ncbi:hypothetical protein ANTQUA_LOCUS482 [Anthophora quadrimaculata]
MNDKLREEHRDRLKFRSTIENGSQTSGRGHFMVYEGVLDTRRDDASFLTVMLLSPYTPMCVHGCAICIYVITVSAMPDARVADFSVSVEIRICIEIVLRVSSILCVYGTRLRFA